MNLKTFIASIFKVLAIVLTLAVLLPSAIKLSHAFNHHQHEVCENDDKGNTHFHEIDLDCEFYKFKLNTNYFDFVNSDDTVILKDYSKVESSLYVYLRSHQQEISYLRGPPSHI